MSMPRQFESEEHYFEMVLRFIMKQQMLYNFPNTKVLTLNVLNQINIDFNELNHFDVFNDLNFGLNQVKHLSYVDEFLATCEELSGDNLVWEDSKLETDLNAPVGIKKKHEILYLAKEIINLCDEANCDTVVDFGSGLGYLDEVIYKWSRLKVLGIECDKIRHLTAKLRQDKYHEHTKQRVKYKNHTITDTSDVAIREIVHSKFSDTGNICLTGLHSCADLTVTAMNLFTKIQEAKAMIIIPCCYHKMELNNSAEQVFKNFPLSDTLKRVYTKYRGWEYLRIPFLRLAAQPATGGKWLKIQVFNLLARSAIQLYADKYNYKLIRMKRKPIKTKVIEQNFDSYLHSASINYVITCSSNNCDSQNNNICKCKLKFNILEVKEMWRQVCDDLTFRKAAIFILLQRQLQPIFENLVLLDRRVYLQERGFNSYFKKVVNEKISPRCLALVVKK